MSGLELGGLVGSLLAGKLSDYLISKSKGKGGNVGKRVQVSSVRARVVLGGGGGARGCDACRCGCMRVQMGRCLLVS